MQEQALRFPMGHCIPTRAIPCRNILSSRIHWNHKGRPMGLCESAKGGKVLDSELSKIWGFHTQTTVVGCRNTSLDHCRGDRILCCSNSFAQFSSDRD